MKIIVNGQKRYYGHDADKPAREKPGTSFVAFDTQEVFVYNQNGIPILVGSNTPQAHTHLEADITNLDKYTQAEIDGKIIDIVAVPASAGSTGVTGQMAFDTGYIYRCTATDTWKRVAIATWV
ncbi:hypothetical protein LCGC14_1256560 [marine sediment metagenome]|uniref:Uncharacterized protein n=1 Tax=marine sediment metagenome TaxID=412755 RepID=A0A0F9L1T5_9ZZZZ